MVKLSKNFIVYLCQLGTTTTTAKTKKILLKQNLTEHNFLNNYCCTPSVALNNSVQHLRLETMPPRNS